MSEAFDRSRKAVTSVQFIEVPDLAPPSCTYLAAAAADDEVLLSSLGDCRAYWLGDGGPLALTHDDSWASEQIAAGTMSPGEAYGDSRAHMITRWLGRDGDDAWRPSFTTFRPSGPGRLVLCSDGLWNYAMTPDALAIAAGNAAGALALAQRLVDFANDAGGADNVTVVVVDLPLPRMEQVRRGT